MKYIIIAVIAFGAMNTFAGSKIKSQADWLDIRYKQLDAIKDINKMKNVGLYSSEEKNKEGVYRYHPNKKGLIVFEDKSWVIIVSYSSHNSERIGDVSLIKTSKGDYWINKGHVCSELLLDSKDKIVSLETFLKTKGKGKPEDILWKPYKPKTKK